MSRETAKSIKEIDPVMRVSMKDRIITKLGTESFIGTESKDGEGKNKQAILD